jgi:hypothetical protein
MKNGEKEGFDVNDVSAYLREVKKWRVDLRRIAIGALQMPGVEDSERENLRRARKSLRSIHELVKIMGELPYTHAQAHALSHLWGTIGAAFVIGSRGIKNPLTEKFLQDKTAQSTAHARNAIPRIKHRDQIDEIVARHVAGCKNPKRAGSKAGIADKILAGVNADLKKELGIDPLSLDWLRKRIILS